MKIDLGLDLAQSSMYVAHPTIGLLSGLNTWPSFLSQLLHMHATNGCGTEMVGPH
jgi:hypothetical protein